MITIKKPLAVIHNDRGLSVILEDTDTSVKNIVIFIKDSVLDTGENVYEISSTLGRDRIDFLFGKKVDGLFITDKNTKVDLYNKSAMDALSMPSSHLRGVLMQLDADGRITYKEENVKHYAEKQSSLDESRFSLEEPVEQTKNMITVHNLNGEDFAKTLDLGGFPMPSIAVVKADQGHSK